MPKTNTKWNVIALFEGGTIYTYIEMRPNNPHFGMCERITSSVLK